MAGVVISRYNPGMKFSPLLLVRQNFPDRGLKDVAGEVRAQLEGARFGSKLKPGARVAIGVGSRGIKNIATIVKATVDYWKDQGARPFVFPAMGSHGAATAEGQADVLAHYGIDEPAIGCPVISQLEVVSLGSTADGIEAFMDRAAYESDGVMLVGRVKWHTDFAGKIESGLFKMMAIGLGKFAGAQRYHTYAYKLGLEKVIRTVGRQVLGSGKILGGLAILEDANHNTAQLTAVKVEEMEQKGRGTARNDKIVDGPHSFRSGHPDTRRDRKKYQRRRNGYEGRKPQCPRRIQSMGHGPSHRAALLAVHQREQLPKWRWVWAWRMWYTTVCSSRSIGILPRSIL